ncbi:GBF-interacting protein 1 isoform X2 [Beta vulgaris subsp. vulgaris]|uniref:GBF-interacting protein 1 isoform X2 n=1 Tax=Beta vulgaris subsp. vulgaris TaxID=3555 RepID=UPI0020369184|nr:GBF-interacting protein 1 isoform X2 [Beta vulgaris subsp. vulgaris]
MTRYNTVRSRSGDESRWKPAHQGRGTRNARGNSFSQYSSNDAGGQRTGAIRKENGVEESRGKGFRNSYAPSSKETYSIQPHNPQKMSSIDVDGPVGLANGSLSGDPGVQSSKVGDAYPSNKIIDASVDNAMSIGLKASSESSDKGHGTAEFVSDNHVNQHDPQNVDNSQVSSSTSERQPAELVEVAHPMLSSEFPVAEKSHVSDSGIVVKPFSQPGVKDVTTKLEKLRFSDGQHVIIPQHIQVPDAVKNVLNFGSLDASFGVRENCDRESNADFNPVTDSALEETVSKLSSCDQDVASTAPQANHADHPQSPSHLPGRNLPIDTEVISSATNPKDDEPKQETLPSVGPPFPVQSAPSYSFGYVPPMLANVLVQPEGFESQAHILNSLGGSSLATSASASTPPPTQSGAGQSTVAISPQPIPLFRQPYPPNYIPYSHYFSPFYVPPTMHQYFGHTAFPPPLPTGNMYLPPPTGPAGMKLSPAHFKPGTNAGHQVPVGVPSGYGAYGASQVGYSQNAAVTSGNSSSGEDLGPPGLKEIFLGQQSEGSAVWFPAAGGRDTASFPLNSFLNLPQQGHHVLNPQSGHGGFAVYHTLQPMGGPAPGLPLLQQSQPVAGSVESVGPPSNSYQQPQRQQQMNWNM